MEQLKQIDRNMRAECLNPVGELEVGTTRTNGYLLAEESSRIDPHHKLTGRTDDIIYRLIRPPRCLKR
jgi:hypothetical protein